MQQFADSHGEKKEVIEKQQQQEDIAEELPEGEELIEKAIELNKSIRHSTSKEGQETLCSEADSLCMEWESLQQMSIDIHCTMDKCLQTWNEFSESHKEFSAWLEDFQQQLEDEPEEPTPEDLESWKELLEEANGKKVHLEVLNDRCEVLMDYSAHTPIRDMTVQLQAAYTNALTNLQTESVASDTEIIEESDNIEGFVEEQKNILQKVYEKAKFNQKNAHKKQKRTYESRKSQGVKTFKLQVGQMVMKRNAANVGRKGGRCDLLWTGPYKMAADWRILECCSGMLRQ